MPKPDFVSAAINAVGEWDYDDGWHELIDMVAAALRTAYEAGCVDGLGRAKSLETEILTSRIEGALKCAEPVLILPDSVLGGKLVKTPDGKLFYGRGAGDCYVWTEIPY